MQVPLLLVEHTVTFTLEISVPYLQSPILETLFRVNSYILYYHTTAFKKMYLFI